MHMACRKGCGVQWTDILVKIYIINVTLLTLSNHLNDNKNIKSSLTKKMISDTALFNPVAGQDVLNNSESSEKFHRPQHCVSNKMCSAHYSRLHNSTTQPNNFLLYNTTQHNTTHFLLFVLCLIWNCHKLQVNQIPYVWIITTHTLTWISCTDKAVDCDLYAFIFRISVGNIDQFLPCDAMRCTVLVIVILSVCLSVCPSVCYTRALCPHGSTYDHDFFTIW